MPSDSRKKTIKNNFGGPEKRAAKIKSTGEKLEKDYEYFEKFNKNYGAVEVFIGFIQEVESAFIADEGEIWSEKGVGEKIAGWEIDYLKKNVQENAEALDMVYNDFKGLFQLDKNPYADTERLLANYRGCNVCEQFIIFLRDIFSILTDVKVGKINIDQAKEKICRLEAQQLSKNGDIEQADLERIYREFKTIIEGR
jgi:hypothetical protein